MPYHHLNVVREHKGTNYDDNLMVPFSGKTIRSEGLSHKRLLVMSFYFKTTG
ncbi:hypothetical protein MA16_Dca026378 [Dendrobium catenatum]|uniref:Uncharacterized protein n=1 Tax=Dendrobium catenatum TaxID=906689 RepID=A0A2I0WEN1_9ASPA|nr:hypothetical protein MA16_Dca026378 [Dendrobium catenatum]